MRDSLRDWHRHEEIIAFYYHIFGMRVHKGVDPREAKREAYDAVTIRFGISANTLRNIISLQKTYPSANEIAMRENARSLISELTLMNEGLDHTKERNNRLISLLKDCFDDYR